ncbi:MAG: putative Single-stranded TG1-3 DNA-binding protein [Streblomastix strix]|uniref:Putative Single-stranded TG1-3 DNA-binding protein n=1 Tax=Streblomastix strix TaxID=222440 RepID=A0A5J4UYZ1_9EUKA|nr:MAG: putative Single-stranded TG1-3 DNA-binding protein [Streblomastix strix]
MFQRPFDSVKIHPQMQQLPNIQQQYIQLNDLLQKMLCIYPQQRITSLAALYHGFFTDEAVNNGRMTLKKYDWNLMKQEMALRFIEIVPFLSQRHIQKFKDTRMLMKNQLAMQQQQQHLQTNVLAHFIPVQPSLSQINREYVLPGENRTSYTDRFRDDLAEENLRRIQVEKENEEEKEDEDEEEEEDEEIAPEPEPKEEEKSIQQVSGSNRLFVGNLSFNTTAEQLTQLFETVGDVIDATIVTFKNKSRGYGFVVMKDEQAALSALKQLDKKDLDGRSINVEVARAEGDLKPRSRRFPPQGDYSGGRRFGRFSRFGRRPRREPSPDPNVPLSTTRVHLGNLPFRLTEEELKAAFDGYDVKKVIIAKSAKTGRVFGFGFVEFENEDEQKRAIKEMDNFDLQGRKIPVIAARERPKPISTPPPDDSPQ